MEAERVRKLLTEERSHLDHLLSQIAQSSELDESQQNAIGALTKYENGSATLQRETSLSIRGRLNHQRDQVEEALQRLDRGEYGLCQVCGRRIGDERLAMLPATRYCREHAGEGERDRGMGSAQSAP